MEYRLRNLFCQLLIATLVLCCHPAAAQTGWTIAEFQSGQLLKKFDRDGNGTLDRAEKTRLGDAFGGIDVPMLPVEPFEYIDIPPPKYIKSSDLAALDNTPPDNPLTNPGATLGRVLFYDRQLSHNNSVSCASCHEQKRGFADPRRFSAGFEGQLTNRNSMGLANLRYSNLRGAKPGFFWDERAETLEAQALMPIQDRIEMGMTLDQLEHRLQDLPYYPALFAAAFGSDRVTSNRAAKALAQFVRSLQSWDSKYDQAATQAAGELSANFAEFSDAENLGKSLFFEGLNGVAEFGCAHCHVPPTFGMPQSFNNGLDLKYTDSGLGALGRPPNEPFTPSNDGKFKAPSLRNVALTTPYMHDGRFQTLEQVIDHYSRGVQPHENLGLAFEDQESDNPQGFHFSDRQQAALVAFLQTLTDHRFIADPGYADPFVRLTEKPTE